MRELGRPIAAETGADNGDLVPIDFRAVVQVVQHREMHLMRVRAGEHRAFSGSRTVDDKTSPAFFNESLAKGMAFFFPVIDATPVHDHGCRHFFR